MPYHKKNKRKFRGKKARRYHKRHKIMQQLASERISFLFKWADEIYDTDPKLAHHAIDIARKISMGTKVRISADLKRNICHGCKHYLKMGKNVRIRSHHRQGYGTWIAKTCLDCGHITRYIIKGKAYKD